MSDPKPDMDHMLLLPLVLREDLDEIRRKESTYKGSWKKRGGVGAFHVFARCWDRLEAQLPGFGGDVFAACAADVAGADGSPMAALRDLRRYLALVEAEVLNRTGWLNIDDAPRESRAVSERRFLEGLKPFSIEVDWEPPAFAAPEEAPRPEGEDPPVRCAPFAAAPSQPRVLFAEEPAPAPAAAYGGPGAEVLVERVHNLNTALQSETGIRVETEVQLGLMAEELAKSEAARGELANLLLDSLSILRDSTFFGSTKEAPKAARLIREIEERLVPPEARGR